MTSYDSTPQLHHSRAVPLAPGNTRLATKPPRTCSSDGCETKLSRYNPSNTCTSHSGWQDTRVRHHA